MEAIALYQLLPAAPYDTIFSLIAEHYKVLNPNMFEFIYDLNIYEALIGTAKEVLSPLYHFASRSAVL